MKRRVEPEWLDELPRDDPAAIGSRRDLQTINRIMGHDRILSKLLLTAAPDAPAGRIVEMGAGDGTFMLRLAQILSPRWARMEVVLVDQTDAVQSETRAAFQKLGWPVEVVTADVFDWLSSSTRLTTDILIANLFLHHFRDDQLASLLRFAAGRAQLFVACEPRRSQFALTFSRLVRLIGCNAVTRHDAEISVRAGFAETELSRLWPASEDWKLRERSARLFTHAFIAEKRDCASHELPS